MYKISIEPEEIEKMPLTAFGGEIKVIDKPGWDFIRAVEYLKRRRVLGFDTESRPSFSPRHHNGSVALLQLSDDRKAFLFRVNTLGMRKGLCSILGSKRIVKVGAAVSDDVHGLQRVYPFRAQSFVDLQNIVNDYGIRDKSVKKMAAIILGYKISKAQQLSNWEAPVLTEAQRKYAATDAWICREMYLKLMDSEKHPLSPEERIPPQQLAQQLAAAERRAQAQQAARERDLREHEAALERRRRRQEAARQRQAEEHEAAVERRRNNPKRRKYYHHKPKGTPQTTDNG